MYGHYKSHTTYNYQSLIHSLILLICIYGRLVYVYYNNRDTVDPHFTLFLKVQRQITQGVRGCLLH